MTFHHVAQYLLLFGAAWAVLIVLREIVREYRRER